MRLVIQLGLVLALLPCACNWIWPLGGAPTDIAPLTPEGPPPVDGPRPGDAGAPGEAAPPVDARVVRLDGGAVTDTTAADGPQILPPPGWPQGVGTAGDDAILAMAVDPVTGNIYVTGYTTANTATGHDVVVMAYSSTGQPLWKKTFGGGGIDEGRGIAVHGATVYVTGGYEAGASIGGQPLPAFGTSDIFLVKLDAGQSGALVGAPSCWGSGGVDRGNAVAVDSAGTVYLTGDIGGLVDFKNNVTAATLGSTDLFLLALAAGSTAQWVKTAGSPASDSGNAVAVNASQVWVVGHRWYLGSPGNRDDVYIAAYKTAATGDLVFESVFETPEGAARAVVLDAAGFGYVTGSFKQTLTAGALPLANSWTIGFSAFVARLDASGAVQQVVTSAGAGETDTVGRGIALQGNSVLVVGSYTGISKIGSTPLPSHSASSPTKPPNDIFVAPMDPTLALGTPLHWGSPQGDVGYAIGTHGGNVYIAGQLGDVVTFGGAPTPYVAGNDGFVAHILP